MGLGVFCQSTMRLRKRWLDVVVVTGGCLAGAGKPSPRIAKSVEGRAWRKERDVDGLCEAVTNWV